MAAHFKAAETAGSGWQNTFPPATACLEAPDFSFLIFARWKLSPCLAQGPCSLPADQTCIYTVVAGTNPEKAGPNYAPP